MEKIMAIILDANICLFAVLYLILALSSQNRLHFDTTLIKEYKDNWSRGPIVDIFISPYNITCPTGYENLITNSFPGNIEGCNCLNTFNKYFKKKIHKKKCNADQMINGCEMILNNSDIKLKVWRGKNLCISRMNKTFWELPIVNQDQNCPKAYQKCGLLDSFNNTLCVKNTDKCPINEIVVMPSYKKAPNGYTTLELDGGYSLHYTNADESGRLIVDIEARQQPPCSHPYEAELGQNDYLLNTKKGENKCSPSIAGVLFDPRFEEMDSQSLNNFYNENNILKVINKLPLYYYFNSSDVASLYKINYFGWNKQCLNTEIANGNYISPLTITPDQSNIDYYSSLNFFLTFICVIHFIFVISMILVYKVCIENMKVSFTVVIITDFLNTILVIIILVFSFVIKTGVWGIINPYEYFIKNKCGDKITNGVMDLAFSDISSVNGLLLAIIIMSIIEIIHLICFNVLVLIRKYKN